MKTYKLSKLITKPEHRLKALIKKHWCKIIRLERIVHDSKDFNIPLSCVTISAIEDNKKHYHHELFKISDLWNFKFNDKYLGSLGSRCYKDNYSKELIEQLNKEMRIKNKKENIYKK